MRWGIGASALLLCTLASAGAQAQAAAVLDSPDRTDEGTLVLPMPPDLRLDADRLGAFFEDEASSERDGMVLSSVFEIVLGTLTLGAGMWLMFDGETFAGLDALRGAGGAVGLPFGVMMLANGIHGLTHVGVAGDRLARWRAALAGGLDGRALGRFEGELRAEAEAARVMRGFSAVTSFALAGGGLGLMLATAITGLDEIGSIYGYAFGGLFALLGMITGLDAVLGESRAESSWTRYREGRGPEGSDEGVDLTVTPTVSDDGAGVLLRGTF